MSNSTVSTAVLSLVTDALAAAATFEQLRHILLSNKTMNMDRAVAGKYKAQKTLLEGYASAIQAPPTGTFMDIPVNEIVEALKHASFTRDFNPSAYSNFLKKLYAAGDAGVEMAQAFELLKAPGA